MSSTYVSLNARLEERQQEGRPTAFVRWTGLASILLPVEEVLEERELWSVARQVKHNGATLTVQTGDSVLEIDCFIRVEFLRGHLGRLMPADIQIIETRPSLHEREHRIQVCPRLADTPTRLVHVGYDHWDLGDVTLEKQFELFQNSSVLISVLDFLPGSK